MAQKPTQHVVPSLDGWMVKTEGAQRASSVHETQTAALAAASSAARERGVGSVVVHRPDGTFREERTYGSDPTKSKG